MGLYLLGIFMGAIDTGIVTPARTVIQRDLGVDEQLGIWLITIYTLAYAAAIPIMGKLADRLGRKPVYLVSIALFGVGSLLCGLSQDVGSFGMLVGARALQALGGGGILPIATAEVGTEVPEERRGMALGLVGAVYGIANIFGASVGSLILDLTGAHNWQWIFYVNVPIALLIVVAGVLALPNHRERDVPPLDLIGTLLIATMIMALLYGLRNLDVFDLGSSLRSVEVYPYLLGFALLLPLFIWTERRAADPVLNLSYFTHRAIGLTLALSFLTGLILMGVVFVPQLAENALRIPSGSGGYLVIVLGLASGVGAPLSGKLTDQFGPKAVLAIGGIASVLAALSVIFWLIPAPGRTSVIVSLLLIGLGLGFVIGSPLNFMMLALTPSRESNSALGTSSLVRAIATTLAPAIMVGFLAHAGAGMQDELTAELPTSVAAPALPYAEALQKKLAAMKADERYAEQLADVQLPDLTGSTTVEINVDGGGQLPDELVELLRTADVTTITARTKIVAQTMFEQQTPGVVADIQDGVQEGIDGLTTGADQLAATHKKMTKSLAKMDKGLAKMRRGLRSMDAALAKMRRTIAQMTSGIAGMTKAISGMSTAIPKMDRARATMSKAIAGMDKGVAGLTKAANGLSVGIAGLDKPIAGLDAALAEQRAALARLEAANDPAYEEQIVQLKGAIAGLEKQRAPLAAQRATLRAKLAKVRSERAKLVASRAKLRTARTRLTAQRNKLVAERAKLRTSRARLITARARLSAAQTKLSASRAELAAARAKLAKGRAALAKARAEVARARGGLHVTIYQMNVLKDAVPGAFDEALQAYLLEIDRRAPAVEATFQTTLNRGFRDLYLFYGASCLLLLVLLPLTPLPARRDEAEA